MVPTNVLYFNRIRIVYDEYSVCDESSNQTPILFGKFESGKHRWCDTLNIMKTARKKVNQYIKKVGLISKPYLPTKLRVYLKINSDFLSALCPPQLHKINYEN